VLTADSKGFAYVDDETPELAISLYKPYRGQGIGTALMKAAIDRLKNTGYRRVSLSVSKDNPAYGLYKRLGFEVFAEDKDDYSMILAL
jgi:ribosomal protein S18 acetylase RimI-like enzyme